MGEILGQLSKLDQASKSFLLEEIFGGAGGEQFSALLGQGEAALRQTIQRAHETGAVIDEELIRKAAEVDAKWNAMIGTASNWAKATILGLVAAGAELVDLRAKMDELFPDEAEGRSVLGDGVYDALAQDRDALDEVAHDVKALKGQYDSLGYEAIGTANQMAALAVELDQMGMADQAAIIRDYADGLRSVAQDYATGAINAEEFSDNQGCSEQRGNCLHGFAGCGRGFLRGCHCRDEPAWHGDWWIDRPGKYLAQRAAGGRA